MKENRLVADVVLVFHTGDDRPKKLHYRHLPVKAWAELRAETGLTPKAIPQLLMDFDGDPTTLAAIIWLERKQRERGLTFSKALLEIEEAELEFELIDVIVSGDSWADRSEEDVAADTEETVDESDPTPAD